MSELLAFSFQFLSYSRPSLLLEGAGHAVDTAAVVGDAGAAEFLPCRLVELHVPRPPRGITLRLRTELHEPKAVAEETTGVVVREHGNGVRDRCDLVLAHDRTRFPINPRSILSATPRARRARSAELARALRLRVGRRCWQLWRLLRHCWPPHGHGPHRGSF